MTDWYALLRDPSARKRIEAVKALVQSNHPNALELLGDAYRRETDPDVKESIRRAGAYLRSVRAPDRTPSTNTSPRYDSVSSTPTVPQPRSKPGWFKVWSIIILFALTVACAFLSLYMAAFLSALLNPQPVLATYPEVFDDMGDSSFGLTFGFGVAFGLLVALLATPFVLIQHFVVHLFAKYLFKGKGSFRALIVDTFKVWIVVILILGTVGVFILFRDITFFQSYTFRFVVSPVVYLIFVAGIGRVVAQVYQLALWKGLVSTLVVAGIFWGIGQLF